jgi:hypothetical protein
MSRRIIQRLANLTARQLKDHVYAYPTFSADIKHMFAHA